MCWGSVRHPASLLIAGVAAHPSHKFRWAAKRRKWFCWACGGVCGDNARRLSQSLREPCKGSGGMDRKQVNNLSYLRKKAG